MNTDPQTPDLPETLATFSASATPVGHALTIPIGSLVLPANLFDPRLKHENSRQFELIAPLIVAARDPAHFVIIDGCKRLETFRRLGESEISCVVVDSASDPIRQGLLRIMLNRGRELHLGERLLFLRWLRGNFSEAQYRAHAEAMNVGNRERHDLENLLDCDEEVVSAVENGSLHPGLATDFSIFPKDERPSLLEFFSTFSFSYQTQREMLDWLSEICYRDQIGLKDLLDEVDPIVSDTHFNVPQKIEKVREHFFIRKFPLYSGALEKWRRDALRLNPDKRFVQFAPCPGFEKNRLEIKLTFTDPNLAADIARRLGAITLDQWESLISPVGT